jgi:acetyltransferase-like isoleucine patch superfamily enzyme
MYSRPRNIARIKGAKVGKRTIISWKIALNCNRKLRIGSDCIVNASYIDNRDYVTIMDNVIINSGVQILRLSHYIDDTCSHLTKYYGEIRIYPYSWIATGSKILPNVREIRAGSIIGAYSVLYSNTDEDGVYVGNPAVKKRTHNSRFTELVVTSQMGGDLIHYCKSI